LAVVTEGFGGDPGQKNNTRKKHGHRFTQISAVKNKKKDTPSFKVDSTFSFRVYLCLSASAPLALLSFSCGIIKIGSEFGKERRQYELHVTIEQDEAGYYVAEVPALPAVFRREKKLIKRLLRTIKEAIEGCLRSWNPNNPLIPPI